MRIPKLPITETLLFRKTFRRFSCNRAGCTCSSVLLISVILALRFLARGKGKISKLEKHYSRPNCSISTGRLEQRVAAEVAL